MDWQALFLNANGRINRQPFWIGFLILFVAGFVLGLVPIIGHFVGLLLLYPWVCLYSKRLHDMGKSGWLQLIPYVVMTIAIVIAFVVGGSGLIAAMTTAGTNDPAATAAVFAGMGGAFLVLIVGLLATVGFTLWVGLVPGDPGDNQYGPSPKLGGGVTPATA